MPAKNPRLTITIEPTLHAQLRRLSELTGNSQSGLISELLDGAGPTLDRVIKVLEIAQDAKDAIRGKLADEMDAAQAKVEAQLGLALDAFEDMSAPLIDMAETIERRSRKRLQVEAEGREARALGRKLAPAGRPGRTASPTRPVIRGGKSDSAGVPTPLSNRGVRSDLTTGGKQATMRAPAELKQKSYKPKSRPKTLDKTTAQKGAGK